MTIYIFKERKKNPQVLEKILGQKQKSDVISITINLNSFKQH